MRFSLMAALLLASTVALAHGPTRQKVTESVTVKATPDQVWAALKDFGAMEKWHPAVEKTVADKGSSVGSTRTLTLKGGGTVVEELESYSDADRKLSYRMKDPGPIPVSNYSATISVKPADGGSVVSDQALSPASGRTSVGASRDRQYPCDQLRAAVARA